MNNEHTFGCPVCGHKFEGVVTEKPSVMLRCPGCRTQIIADFKVKGQIGLNYKEPWYGPLYRMRRA